MFQTAAVITIHRRAASEDGAGGSGHGRASLRKCPYQSASAALHRRRAVGLLHTTVAPRAVCFVSSLPSRTPAFAFISYK